MSNGIPDFEAMEDRLRLKFTNRELLLQVFVHRSYHNEHPEVAKSNARLAFLGDAVLGLAVAEHLYKDSDASEGKLTELRKLKVEQKALAGAARGLNLGRNLLMSHGEQIRKGRDRPKALADSFEALVGAIFLEFGYSYVYRFA